MIMIQHYAAKLSRLAWLIAISGLLLTIFASLQVKMLNQSNAIKNFAFTADQIAIKIEERLAAYALVLRGGAGLFDASGSVTRQEWTQYVKKLQVSQAVSGISGMGVITLMSAENLEDHIAEIRSEGLADYQVWPAGNRDRYSSILFISPATGNNLRVLGYDMLSEPVRRAAMLKAAKTGKATLSGRVDLKIANNNNIQAGTLMFVPLYQKGALINTVEQRQQALIGWTYCAYRMDDLMQDILADWSRHQEEVIELRVYDGNNDIQQLLYVNHERYNNLPANTLQQQRIINFNDRQWLLIFDHLQPGQLLNNTSSWMTALIGFALTILLFFLFQSISGTRTRALALAKKLTKRINQREQQFEKLLNRLRAVTSRIPGMVYEYRLYPDGRACFPYASEGIHQIYRVSHQQVQEDGTLVQELIHPADLAEVLSSTQHSAETLEPWRHEYRVIFADGTQRWLFGDSQPHKEADGSISWYGMMTDITDRKQTELALKAANQQTQRFKEALDHVPACIFMKDTHSRYIYANRTTLKLFNCTAQELLGHQGTPFFSKEELRRYQQVDSYVLSGEQIQSEFEASHQDGKKVTFLEVKTPIYDGSESKTAVGLLGIATDITQLKANEQKLERLAHYDPLTQLPNRVLLADRLQQAMLQARRRQQSLAVVYLDLDGFKQINDSYGHTAGDQLLMTVTARMKNEIREGDTLSRLGGDEFVAILLDLADLADSAPLLNRLLQAASRPIQLGRHRLQVSASLGVTFYPQAEDLESEQLIRQADQAMYQAKLAGKNRYYLFDAEQDRNMRSHHESLEHISEALKADQFVLYYQPKVNMRTGKVLGVEALIRWQHPEQGLLAPAHFLPVIEDHPLAVNVGNWVLDTALQQIRNWQQQGVSLLVSVNICARQLQQPDFVHLLERLLQSYPDISAELLELEILETSTLGDLAQISNTLEACRALGVSISLDDFGTGYSSLTYLKRLPTNVIKIDQSFIRDILQDSEDLAILDGVLSLAGAFGRKVIAEGVETLQHGDTLLRIGCDIAQGYGIAKPMPAANILTWVATWQPEPHWADLRRLSREKLPLLYASIEHNTWFEDIANTLHNHSKHWPQLDIEQGYLNHWLASQPAISPERLATQYRLHHQIRDLALELKEAHQAGQASTGLDKLDALFALRDQLFHELEDCMNE